MSRKGNYAERNPGERWNSPEYNNRSKRESVESFRQAPDAGTVRRVSNRSVTGREPPRRPQKKTLNKSDLLRYVVPVSLGVFGATCLTVLVVSSLAFANNASLQSQTENDKQWAESKFATADTTFTNMQSVIDELQTKMENLEMSIGPGEESSKYEDLETRFESEIARLKRNFSNLQDHVEELGPTVLSVTSTSNKTSNKTIADAVQANTEAVNTLKVQFESYMEGSTSKFEILSTWQKSANLYFKLFQEHVDFDTAKKKCVDQGGTLAAKILREGHNLQYIAGKYFQRSDSPGRAWVGYSDIRQEGIWDWVDAGGTYNELIKWSDGEPNNGGGVEDCAHIAKIFNGSLYLNDVACTERRNYFCEVVIQP